MSERIVTLFGEEIVPEQLKAVGRSRAKKKPEEKTEAAPTENEPVAEEVTPQTEPETVVATTDAQQELHLTDPASEDTIIEHAEIPQVEEEQRPEVKQITKKEKVVPAILPDDWQGSKQYYSIGEVADLFKVKTSHIRFWTNEFKLKVRTTRKGDRLYTPDQIKELRAINHLVKERGFTLKGAKTRLKAPEKMEVETVDLKQSLLHLRNKLVAIKNQLK